MSHPQLTLEGRSALEGRLARLRDELRQLGPMLADPEMERRLDDRYDQLWADVVALDELLAQAAPVDPPEHPEQVALGSWVDVSFAGGGVERLRIVHPAEAVLDDERVSADSPVARALLGRRVGDACRVRTPRGVVDCTVLRVRHSEAVPV